MSIPTSIKISIAENKPTLTHLNLSNHGLNDDDMVELQELLQNNLYINSLNLERNNITSEGMKTLSLLCSKIHTLNVSQNKIKDDGIAFLFKNISPKLKWLDISDNAITQKSADLFLKVISDTSSLKYTNVEKNNGIDEETIQKLKGIEKNQSKEEEKTPVPAIDLNSMDISTTYSPSFKIVKLTSW